MSSLSILLAGFLLGMKHATEADHLAAVATLAAGQSSFAHTMKQGMAWGIGHTLTLMLFGGVVLALGKSIPAELARALESLVGLMLIALGGDVLRRLRRARIHFHVHRHSAGITHMHAHSHAGESVHGDSLHRHVHVQRPPLRALAIGMMHGMAGSAALILLSLEAVQSLPLGMIYIALFGAGSVAGMALLSAVIAVPLRLTAGSLEPLHNTMIALVGIYTFALGAVIVYRAGFVQELLLG